MLVSQSLAALSKPIQLIIQETHPYAVTLWVTPKQLGTLHHQF